MLLEVLCIQAIMNIADTNNKSFFLYIIVILHSVRLLTNFLKVMILLWKWTFNICVWQRSIQVFHWTKKQKLLAFAVVYDLHSIEMLSIRLTIWSITRSTKITHISLLHCFFFFLNKSSNRFVNHAGSNASIHVEIIMHVINSREEIFKFIVFQECLEIYTIPIWRTSK